MLVSSASSSRCGSSPAGSRTSRPYQHQVPGLASEGVWNWHPYSATVPPRPVRERLVRISIGSGSSKRGRLELASLFRYWSSPAGSRTSRPYQHQVPGLASEGVWTWHPYSATGPPRPVRERLVRISIGSGSSKRGRLELASLFRYWSSPAGSRTSRPHQHQVPGLASEGVWNWHPYSATGPPRQEDLPAIHELGEEAF